MLTTGNMKGNSDIPFGALWFFRRPPWFYLVCYIVTVVVFALFFRWQEHGFYQPYCRHELSYRKHSRALEAALTEAFREALATDRGQILEGITIDPRKLQVQDLVAKEDCVLFSLFLEIRASGGTGLRRWIPVRLSPRFAFDYRYKDLNKNHLIILHPQLELLESPPDGGPLSKSHINPQLHFIFSWINVQGTTVKKLKSLLSARNGFPGEIPGGFWRMLYFSVVTITTLGYGDISPVTGAVRFLVGLESVLGIFLLGSFISSLWLRQKESLTRGKCKAAGEKRNLEEIQSNNEDEL